MSNNTVIMYLTRREAERFLKNRNHAELTTFLGGVVVGSVGAVAGTFGLAKVKDHIDKKRCEDSFRFDNEI